MLPRVPTQPQLTLFAPKKRGRPVGALSNDLVGLSRRWLHRGLVERTAVVDGRLAVLLVRLAPADAHRGRLLLGLDDREREVPLVLLRRRVDEHRGAVDELRTEH